MSLPTLTQLSAIRPASEGRLDTPAPVTPCARATRPIRSETAYDYSPVCFSALHPIPAESVHRLRNLLAAIFAAHHDLEGKYAENIGDEQSFELETIFPVAVQLAQQYSGISLSYHAEKRAGTLGHASKDGQGLGIPFMNMQFLAPKHLKFLSAQSQTPTWHLRWNNFTRQMRRHAGMKGVRVVLATDAETSILLVFENPEDRNAKVGIAYATTLRGGLLEAVGERIPSKELLLLGVYLAMEQSAHLRSNNFTPFPTSVDTSTPPLWVPPSLSLTRIHKESFNASIFCTSIDSAESSRSIHRRQIKHWLLNTTRTIRLPITGRLETARRILSTPPAQLSDELVKENYNGLAVKQFLPDKLKDLTAEANSYQALKALQGVSIPICYGVYRSPDDSSDEGYYLLLEAVKGRKFAEVLQVGVNKVAALSMFEKLFKLVIDLHKKYNIVHGNIGPSNVLLAEGDVVVLIDFAKSSTATPSRIRNEETMVYAMFSRVLPEDVLRPAANEILGFERFITTEQWLKRGCRPRRPGGHGT